MAAVLAGAIVLTAQAGVSDPERARGPARGPAGSTVGETSVLAAGKFLVASRNLRDTHFARTVVLLVDYDRKGAKGLIINRRTALRLSSVFPKYEPINAGLQKVFEGGPVGRDTLLMLVRSRLPPAESVRVFADVHLSTNERLLEDLLRKGKAQADFRVYSGYAGWAPGQLDAEVARDDWYVVDSDPRFVFDADPDQTWRRLLPPDPTRTTRLTDPSPAGPTPVALACLLDPQPGF